MSKFSKALMYALLYLRDSEPEQPENIEMPELPELPELDGNSEILTLSVAIINLSSAAHHVDPQSGTLIESEANVEITESIKSICRLIDKEVEHNLETFEDDHD